MSSRRLTQTHIHKGLSTGLATVLGTLSSKFSKCQGLAGTGKPENPSGPLRLTRRLKTTMTSSSRLYTSTDSPPTSGERSPITPDTLHSPTGPKAPSINPVVRRTSSVLGSSCQGRCHWSRRQGQGDRSTDTRSPVRAWHTAGIPAPSAPGSPGKCRPKEHSPYERQPQRHRAARAGAPRGLWLLGVILACSLFGVGTPLELRMPQWAGATLGPRKGGRHTSLWPSLEPHASLEPQYSLRGVGTPLLSGYNGVPLFSCPIALWRCCSVMFRRATALLSDQDSKDHLGAVRARHLAKGVIP